MALKGCIAKAGKALDPDDRKYMNRLMSRGKSDDEVLRLLKANITREQNEAVELIEAEGLTVARVEVSVSEENKGSSDAEATPEGLAEAKGKPLISEESGSSTVPSEKDKPSFPQGPKGSAKPNPEGPKEGLSFGSTAQSAADDSQPRDSGGATPLFLTRDTAEAAMAKLAEGSEIIQRFLADKNGGMSKIFLDAFTNSYMPDLDAINITGRKPTESKKGRRLDLNNAADLKLQRTLLEHEITHANTIAYMSKHIKEQTPEVVRDMKYFSKAIQDMLKFDVNKLSDEAVNRMSYIALQSDPVESIAEFIAVMGAETDTAAEIYAAFGRQAGIKESTLKGRIEALMTRVASWFAGLTDADLKKDIDIDKLAGAMARTLEQGREFREQRYDEAVRYSAAENRSFNYGPKTTKVEYTKKASFDYLNYAVASMLNSRLERGGKKMLGNIHNIMNDRFPLYTDAANKAIGIYDSSPALQQFVHAVTGERVNKVKKADVLSKFAEINAQRTEIINDQVSKLTRLTRDLSETEKTDLNSFVQDMPLHDYFVLAGDLSTAEDIEAEAELLRKELWRINARAVRDVEQLIDWNVDGASKGTKYNMSAINRNPQGDFGIKLRKFHALESIKRIGAAKFEKLLKNQELFDVIKDNSVANAISTLDIGGTNNVRDSLVMDYYADPFQIKAIEQKDFKMYEFGEETGWKVLKAPTRTELGIVYKPTIDSTDLAGAYTDMKLSSTDIDVGQHMKKYSGVVETANGFKLRLTKQNKKDLGLIDDFTQSLVRSTAHSVAAKESEIIRNSVLQDDTWMQIGEKGSIEKLEGIIKSDNIDNPWFLKLEEGTDYSKLPSSVRAKYMPVAGRASNVNQFNEKVDLVRKDISHWLLGGSAKSLFENPKLRWATRILKNLVSGAKIGMIVLNPIKIANDNLSNLTYLGVLGLDPVFIAKNYKEISTDFAEYSELQREIFQLKLQLVSRPDSTKAQKRLKSLQKRLSANSIGDIGDKGFVNSLGSDLVSRSADTLSGFQADMHKALEYLLTDKAGNRNLVSHFITQLQKVGFQAEDFFGYLGNIASNAKSTKLLGQELDQVAARIREIKTEDDVINYVAQFTTSPSSEAVRFGSAMTDLTDVLAKETLYRHFIETKKMSPEAARIEVLDSFPDYKENMPLSIKGLSDVGILMFPSFWLRIQKIIYRMARDKPVNLATELMVQEMLGTDVNTIFEANIINKSNTFGGLLHTPFEPVGLGSVVPMHVF